MTDTLPPSESAGIARKSCLSGCTLACLYYGSILLLILALPVWWFCIYAPPLVISEATTRITGPLTADGQIDFFKALEERIYPPEMKTDDNGFRDLVRLFGFVRRDDTDGIRSGLTSMTPEEREFYRLQKYEKLGLDSDVPPKLVFPDDPLKVFMDFYESKGEPIPADVVRISPGCCGRTDRTVLPNSWLNPWTLEQFSMFADWLKEIEEPMNAIAEAVRKPVFVVPILQNCNALDLSRQTRLILQARAMYRLGNGDIDGAIDDKLTLYRLGRMISQKCFRVQYQTGAALETTAAGIPIYTNPEQPPTQEQIQRLLDGINALPPRGLPADVYECERFMTLSLVQRVKQTRSNDVFGIVVLSGRGENEREEKERSFKENIDALFFAAFAASIDWNVVFRRVNEVYDAIKESPQAAYSSLQETQHGVCVCSIECFLEAFLSSKLPLTSHGRGTLLANILLNIMLPSEDLFESFSVLRPACAENMQRLTLAILLYKLEHGELPGENWVEQIKPYLGENPEQYFSCPANPSSEGKTTYVLVQYGDELPADIDTLLLVELTMPVPFAEAVISADDVPELIQQDPTASVWHAWRWHNEPHRQGMNLAYRNGAVRFLSAHPREDCERELFRSLGRGSESEPDLHGDDNNE